MQGIPESQGTTLAYFRSGQQAERFAQVVRQSLGGNATAMVVPHAGNDFIVALDPRDPFVNGDHRGSYTAGYPDVEVGYSLLLIWIGPFPPELQQFLVVEGIRRPPIEGPFANLVQMPINRCYWAPGDDQGIWDINYALIGRAVQGASVARGLATFKRLVGVDPSQPIRDPDQCPVS